MSPHPELDSMKQRNSPLAPTPSESGLVAERRPSIARLLLPHVLPRTRATRTLLAARSPQRTVLVRSSGGSLPSIGWLGWSLSPDGSVRGLRIVLRSCVRSGCSCAASVGRSLVCDTSMRWSFTLEAMDGTPICSLTGSFRETLLQVPGDMDSWIYDDQNPTETVTHQLRGLGSWPAIWPSTSPKQQWMGVLLVDIDMSAVKDLRGQKSKQTWSSQTLFACAGHTSAW